MDKMLFCCVSVNLQLFKLASFVNKWAVNMCHSTRAITIQFKCARALAQQSLQACSWWGEYALLIPGFNPLCNQPIANYVLDAKSNSLSEIIMAWLQWIDVNCYRWKRKLSFIGWPTIQTNMIHNCQGKHDKTRITSLGLYASVWKGLSQGALKTTRSLGKKVLCEVTMILAFAIGPQKSNHYLSVSK